MYASLRSLIKAASLAFGGLARSICLAAVGPNKSLQRTAKHVTPFACAKVAPHLPAAELGAMPGRDIA